MKSAEAVKKDIRIIRVKSCSECPYREVDIIEVGCAGLNNCSKVHFWIRQQEYRNEGEFPENCPLYQEEK